MADFVKIPLCTLTFEELRLAYTHVLSECPACGALGARTLIASHPRAPGTPLHLRISFLSHAIVTTIYHPDLSLPFAQMPSLCRITTNVYSFYSPVILFASCTPFIAKHSSFIFFPTVSHMTFFAALRPKPSVQSTPCPHCSSIGCRR
jgi:predicted RNA-binding Zn-ribbon protein involved in translation (DUF1610 family)